MEKLPFQVHCGERERERERERWFYQNPLIPTHKNPSLYHPPTPTLLIPTIASLSLSIIHALFSATSWQVRKITENEEQRKRPIKQKRKERGAINTFFFLFPFLLFCFSFVLMLGGF